MNFLIDRLINRTLFYPFSNDTCCKKALEVLSMKHAKPHIFLFLSSHKTKKLHL